MSYKKKDDLIQEIFDLLDENGLELEKFLDSNSNLYDLKRNELLMLKKEIKEKVEEKVEEEIEEQQYSYYNMDQEEKEDWDSIIEYWNKD
ncbi:MAG: hypothetical protein MR593_10890 [Intestinibacter sp.]|uniref:hypothetical protein n=1 Tax=Intestinibacter sp. TaxID=1965304 RepID=UPI0025C0C38D|nr:hypothetical protein [Intestinibacter sp.]MCI6738609.1 hypothetical protein [Intestinibacter sp.]